MTGRSVFTAIFRAFFLVLILAVAVPTTLFLWRPVAPPAPASVMVEPGRPFGLVAKELEERGVVADAFALKILSRLRGDGSRIQSGEYLFDVAATPGEVLDRLVAGDVRRIRFTVPEGLTVKEIASRMEQVGISEPGDFLRLAKDSSFAESLGVEADSLEGYLFPETYTVEAKIPADRLIRAMVGEFRKRLDPNLVEEAQRRGLSLHQLVILASIVQKEAGNSEEMPLVSAVFHNRLRLGMPLQADPTVIYGITDFDGNITREHLRTPTPYNTYRMKGLPYGPIANPGEDSLRAAAIPAEVDALYFVAKGDGTHVFTRTLDEHNKAVRRYQLRR